MDLPLILGAITAIFCGSILQSAVGFGAGLLAIPILVWLGIPLPGGLALMQGVVAVHAPYNVYRLRHDVPWSDAAKMTGIRLLGVPVGVFVLARYVGSDVSSAKQVVGASLLVALVLVGRNARLGLEKPSACWQWIAGLSSGFLAGLVGMGGPPLVLLAVLHDWTPARFRAYLWALFLLLLPFSTALLLGAFGARLLPYIGCGILSAPVIWFGSRVGLRVAAQWQRPILVRWVKATLYVMAVASLLAPFIAPR